MQAQGSKKTRWTPAERGSGGCERETGLESAASKFSRNCKRVLTRSATRAKLETKQDMLQYVPSVEAKVRARVHSFLRTDYAERALLHTRVANGERELAAMFLQQEMHAQEIPRIGMTGGASLEHLVERARYVVAQQVENDEATRGHLEDAVGSHHDTLWHSAMQRTA